MVEFCATRCDSAVSVCRSWEEPFSTVACARTQGPRGGRGERGRSGNGPSRLASPPVDSRELGAAQARGASC
jgi:hypothetical protein